MANAIDDPRIRDDLRGKVLSGCRPDDLHHVLVDLMRCGLTPADVLTLVSDSDNEISRHFTSEKSAKGILTAAYQHAKRPVLGSNTWVENAVKYRDACAPSLVFHQGEFFRYVDGAYRVEPPRDVKSSVRSYLAGALREVLNKEKTKAAKDNVEVFDEVDFNPDRNDREELVSALEDICNIDVGRTVNPPCWLDDDPNMPPANECIALKNGILHRPSRLIMLPTPNYFTLNALPFDYHPEASCPLWLKTLKEWWPDVDGKPASEIALLQEMIGLFLTYDTSWQRIFAILGDGGSGKGTLSTVIFSLIGNGNYAMPTLDSLGGEFGRQNLIGKLLMCISETQFGKKGDPITITGYLKAISGEDPLDINRKQLSFWTGKLLARILLLCNKIPSFVDDSDALGRRLIAIQMRQKFTDKSGKKPNRKLRDMLAEERPGILLWALEGYERLIAQDEFSLTDAAREAADQFLRAASTVRSFVEDMCTVEGMEHDQWVEEHRKAALAKTTMPFIHEAALYGAYRRYCMDKGTAHESHSNFVAAITAFDHDRIRGCRPLLLGPDGKPRLTPSGGKLFEPRSLRGIRLTGKVGVGNGAGNRNGQQGALPLPDDRETPF